MPVYIIGAGIAGLFAALKLSPRPVVVISPSPIADTILPSPAATASSWAQGGIAAALGPQDSPALHIQDTLTAGAGLCDSATVKLMCESAPARIWDLIALGVPFDRAEDGSLSLGLEAVHSRHRIARIQGDRAGAAIMRVLSACVRQAPHITLLDHHEVVALRTDDRGISGLCLHDLEDASQQWLPASSVVMATGGIGALYEVTTNPRGSYGAGLAMAADIGATLHHLEFIQFHPTAMLLGRDPAPLATEALRGEGAWLVNELHERFMLPLHPLAELAPRDVVARAIHQQIMSGHRVYLDAREAIGEQFALRFPTVYAACAQAGINPATQPLPIAPAAHYHIGGIATDLNARSSIDGLYACGEVACTGAHGANRLASNSLLESLVFAHQAAMDILGAQQRPMLHSMPQATPFDLTPAESCAEFAALRKLMTRAVGIERSGDTLSQALETISGWHAQHCNTLYMRHMTATALHITQAALARPHSIGCHFRSDSKASHNTEAGNSLASGV